MSAIEELKVLRREPEYQNSTTLLHIAVLFAQSASSLHMQGFHKEAATRALAGIKPEWELGAKL